MDIPKLRSFLFCLWALPTIWQVFSLAILNFHIILFESCDKLFEINKVASVATLHLKKMRLQCCA